MARGFTGGYTIIKDYMRKRELCGREMFVPLAHPSGHAQADFGEAIVIIGGLEQKAHFFVLDLPHSDACFVRAYPAATAPFEDRRRAAVRDDLAALRARCHADHQQLAV
jgi:transposase